MIKNYIVQVRSLKQALDHGLILKNVHKVIQFNQEAWLKQHIDMNTKLRTEAKNYFKKDFFKSMNNSVFRKTMGNVRKHRDIKLETTYKKKKSIGSKTFITIQQYTFQELISNWNEKKHVKMNVSISRIVDIRN